MESELPYDGNLQIALKNGDNTAIDKIVNFRRDPDIIFSLPKIPDMNKKCELKIIFLDELGLQKNTFCGKKVKLEEDVLSSNTFYLVNISLKKMLDTWYILEEDLRLISTSKEIIGIPIYDNVYSLVDKTDYHDYSNVYFSLFTRLYWKLKNKSPNIYYENFRRIPERDMIENLYNLIKSHNQ